MKPSTPSYTKQSQALPKTTDLSRKWTKQRIFQREIIFPTIFGILFLLFWEVRLFHFLFQLELYQLPVPSDILQSTLENRSTLMFYTLYTGAEIVGGFLLGSVLGLIIATLASLFPSIGGGGVTVVAALNAVPIVALAPIMNNWFGDSISSRIGVVTILTMATMTVNVYKGLRSIDGTYLELMHSYAAKKSQIFLKLRFKHSLPYIFAALKINMSTSIIGAIVGEFFISSRGLGYLMSDQIQLANMPLAWSCIVISSLLGIALYSLVERSERLFMPWKVFKR